MTHFLVSGAGRVGRLALVVLGVGVGRPVAGQRFSATRTDYATPSLPLNLTVTDVNADGRPDLVTTNPDNGTVCVRLAAGAAGGFAATDACYPVPISATNVAVVDVNADGRPDLVTVSGSRFVVGSSFVKSAIFPVHHYQLNILQVRYLKILVQEYYLLLFQKN